MLLSQEYHKRLGLSCPIMLRPEKENGYCLLFMNKKQQAKGKWALLSICNRAAAHAPPFYNIDWSQPTYNSGNSFSNLSPSVRIEWEEYDIAMAQLLSGFHGLEPVTDVNLLQLFAWEIFLYCNDDSVASMPIAVQKSLWTPTDERKSVEERIQLLNECVNNLPRYKNLLGRYQAVKSMICDRHAPWLGDIVVKIRVEPQFSELLAQTF